MAWYFFIWLTDILCGFNLRSEFFGWKFSIKFSILWINLQLYWIYTDWFILRRKSLWVTYPFIILFIYNICITLVSATKTFKDPFTLTHLQFASFRKQPASNFIEIALRHWCSPVNLLHIFRTPFPKNSSGWLLLSFQLLIICNQNFDIGILNKLLRDII